MIDIGLSCFELGVVCLGGFSKGILVDFLVSDL